MHFYTQEAEPVAACEGGRPPGRGSEHGFWGSWTGTWKRHDRPGRRKMGRQEPGGGWRVNEDNAGGPGRLTVHGHLRHGGKPCPYLCRIKKNIY